MANYTTGSARTSYRHGYRGHPIYKVWQNMRSRCLNPRNTHWADYGGRGISLEPRWLDPLNFIHDMLPTWKKGLEIDRKDNDGNYTKDNCRWITRSAQVRNTRVTTWVESPEGRLCIADAMPKYGKVSYATARMRIHRGMDPWLAIITPKDQGGIKQGTITYIIHPGGSRTAIKTDSHPKKG